MNFERKLKLVKLGQYVLTKKESIFLTFLDIIKKHYFFDPSLKLSLKNIAYIYFFTNLKIIKFNEYPDILFFVDSNKNIYFLINTITNTFQLSYSNIFEEYSNRFNFFYKTAYIEIYSYIFEYFYEIKNTKLDKIYYDLKNEKIEIDYKSGIIKEL